MCQLNDLFTVRLDQNMPHFYNKDGLFCKKTTWVFRKSFNEVIFLYRNAVCAQFWPLVYTESLNCSHYQLGFEQTKTNE